MCKSNTKHKHNLHPTYKLLQPLNFFLLTFLNCNRDATECSVLSSFDYLMKGLIFLTCELD